MADYGAAQVSYDPEDISMKQLFIIVKFLLIHCFCKEEILHLSNIIVQINLLERSLHNSTFHGAIRS